MPARRARPPRPVECQMGTYANTVRSVCDRDPSGCFAHSFTLAEGRHKPIASARHRGDEARLAPVILESRTQVTNLAVDNIAFGDVVHTPQRVQDLLAGNHSASVGRQQVQQALLQRCEMELRATCPYGAVEDVDL